jgi:hypothetical protein
MGREARRGSAAGGPQSVRSVAQDSQGTAFIHEQVSRRGRMHCFFLRNFHLHVC